MLNKRSFSILFFLFFFVSFVLVSCTPPAPSNTYTISSTSETGGTISPIGSITIAEGDSQTFTINPDGCHIVDQVLVDGQPMGSIDTYTFPDIQQDHTISVSFAFPSRRVYNADTGIEYEIIQHAIDAALDGQTIVVCPGTYMENIEFDSRDLTLCSCDPSDPAIVSATIIDGKGTGSVVRLVNDTSTITGFTIQNGNASHGGGIYVDEASSIIEKNNIHNNNATLYGGGIYVYKSTPTIIGNTIIGNWANTNGGGIYIDSTSSPTIGGANSTDTADFNTICSNNPNQVEPDVYPYNYISNMCMVVVKS
jgi:parallel beta-helix repeat protein